MAPKTTLKALEQILAEAEKINQAYTDSVAKLKAEAQPELNRIASALAALDQEDADRPNLVAAAVREREIRRVSDLRLSRDMVELDRAELIFERAKVELAVAQATKKLFEKKRAAFDALNLEFEATIALMTTQRDTYTRSRPDTSAMVAVHTYEEAVQRADADRQAILAKTVATHS